MIDNDKFYAWLDGELPADDAASVAAAVAADPALARKAEAHRALRVRLGAAFDPLMAAPVPDRLGAAPVDLLAARAARRSPPRALPQWAAMAATLVVGLTVGTLAGRGDDSPFAVKGGQLVAAAALDQALDTRLASAGHDGAGPRIGLTFRASDGAICRTFSGVGSGLACNSGDQWQVRGLFGGGESAAGDYRMAAGDDPRLAALVAETIVGEPFDADREKAVKARRWR